jgi:hypothetical protein
VDASGDIVDATSYSPYGVSAGMAETSYGFTGEWTDSYIKLTDVTQQVAEIG